MRRSRYLLLGIVTLLFGIAILTFNFGNEYLALRGTTPFRELPSIASAVIRLGAVEPPYVEAALLQPSVYWPEQLYRIGIMTLPYVVNPYKIKASHFKLRYPDYPAVALGALVVGVGLTGLVGLRRRPAIARLLATLIFSGFCWAVAVRVNVAPHEFESVFYIGMPLAAFLLALRAVRRRRYWYWYWSRGRLSPYFAVAALAVFILSVSAMAGVGQSRKALAVEAAHMDDYAAIREQADDRHAIYMPHRYELSAAASAAGAAAGSPRAPVYFLSGKTLVYPDRSSAAALPAGNYLLLTTRADHPALLTPDNRYVFLYDWTLYDQWRRTANQYNIPIIADDWRVYLGHGNLTYQSPECAHRDARFFLHFVPRSAVDLPLHRRECGFDNHDFEFGLASVKLTDGTCVIERRCPTMTSLPSIPANTRRRDASGKGIIACRPRELRLAATATGNWRRSGIMRPRRATPAGPGATAATNPK